MLMQSTFIGGLVCRARSENAANSVQTFGSNAEFFQAVADLIAKLDGEFHRGAAAQLKRGLSCLNGLFLINQALFLESIEKVQADESDRFAADDQEALERIRAAAHTAMYER